MRKLVNGIDTVLKWLVIIFMGANVINVLWQVFTRFILNDPSTFTEELARYLLIWVSFLGAAYIYREKLHLAVEAFFDKMKERTQYKVQIFLQICVFLFSLIVLVIGGYDLTSLTFQMEQVSPALQINIGYVYMVVPISGILFMFYSVMFMNEYGKTLKGQPSEILKELETSKTQSAE